MLFQRTPKISVIIFLISILMDNAVLLKMPKKSVGSDTLSSAVKTLKTPDGKELKIHGNEDDGFRVSVGGKMANNKFSNLDEAAKACESYIKKGFKKK